ncbi:MAG: TrmH family RNA methyltransferase [Planctomycetaceae bacterium]
MEPTRITDLSDRRLDPFRSLRKNNATRDRRLFVAEGTTVVQRLFESRFECELVLVSDKKWDGFCSGIPEGVPVLRIAHSLICELVGYKFHKGVLACGRRQTSPDLAALIENGGDRQIFIVAPHVIDPENIGVLIRIGAAFGVTAVVLGEGCADAFSRRVLRVSMANGLFTPIVVANDMGTVFELLRTHDVRTFATLLDPSATTLETIEPPKRSALVFGNETHGLSDEVLNFCDDRITIPMQGGTDSLNVAVAAGIFLFHFRNRAAE